MTTRGGEWQTFQRGKVWGHIMNANSRAIFRMFVCVAFIVSLYGGVALLTAAFFAKGFLILGAISGLVLSAMTATTLALFGLAWSMTTVDSAEDRVESVAQPG